MLIDYGRVLIVDTAMLLLVRCEDEYLIEVEDITASDLRAFSDSRPPQRSTKYEATIEGLINGHEYEFLVEVRIRESSLELQQPRHQGR